MQQEIEKIRLLLPKLFEEVNQEIYLNYSGQKSEMNTSQIYSKYMHLANKDLILKLRDQKDKRIRYLAAFLEEMYMHLNTSKIRDKVSTIESNTYIRYGENTISYRIAPAIIANEHDREKRRALYMARIKASYRINKFLYKQWLKFHEISKELGYKNYLEYCSSINFKDYDQLESQALNFLSKTKSIYIDIMEEEFKKMSLDFHQSERHDLAFYFRAKEFDWIFPKEKMIQVFESFTNNFGLSLKKYPNIIIDDVIRENKTTRAFVSPIKIPEKIYLVITPKGGQDDYLSLFHESGHAFHFANVNKETPMEFKYLGPSSFTETFAFLFEYLLLDEAFIKHYLKYDKRYLRFQYLYKLYFLRRYCSKLLYEIRLNSRKPDRHSSFEYKRIMENNMVTKHERALYLSDIDPGMYTAEYLEAWFFEVQLKNFLREKYGEDWFRKEEAGNFLKKIWSEGTRFLPTELARE